MEVLLPSFRDFEVLATQDRYQPFLKKITFDESPVECYRRLQNHDGPGVLLESARVHEKTGRYSIVATRPFLVFQSKGREMTLSDAFTNQRFVGDPFEALKRILAPFSSDFFPGMPPFAGGAIGFIGYEAKNIIEPRLSSQTRDDLRLPDLYFPFFDEGVIFDHIKKEVFLFAHVRCGKNRVKTYERAWSKIERLHDRLKKPESLETRSHRFLRSNRVPSMEHSFSKKDFLQAVGRIKKYIRAGEIFQANLSQRFAFELEEDPFCVYRALRQVNPSPFFGYLDAQEFQIVSGSPERLVRSEAALVETRPIAGTRRRGKNATQDEAIAIELLLSEKERAEHVMLVDLERNDLGRVCEYGSIAVDELMTLENYSHVKHIVSNVRGILRKNLGAVDILKAVFPGGTITGTPKVRCMEILDALEPVARGPYTGSMGYIGFNGNMDWNILIRSLVVKAPRAYLQVGAGIVADSIAEKEYEETLYKAEAILSALFGSREAEHLLERFNA